MDPLSRVAPRVSGAEVAVVAADCVSHVEPPIGTSAGPRTVNPRDGRAPFSARWIRVAVVMRDPADQRRGCQALADVAADAVVCEEPSQLAAMVEHRRVTIAVIDGPDGTDRETAETIRALKAKFPALTVLVYCRFTRAGMRVAVAATRAGADEVVVRGCDDTGNALRKTLDGARGSCAVSALAEELRALIPSKALSLVQYCLLNGARAPSVAGVALALGTNRRTLVTRTTEAGLPSPRLLIGWGRLLAAAGLLARSDHSVEQVAYYLGFGSASELRNMCRRYTGLRPRDVRAGGGVIAILPFLRRAIVPSYYRVDVEVPRTTNTGHTEMCDS